MVLVMAAVLNGYETSTVKEYAFPLMVLSTCKVAEDFSFMERVTAI